MSATKKSPMRIKAGNVQRETFIAPDGLDVCIDCWVLWMGSDDRDLSASRMKLAGGDELPDRDADGNIIKTAYENNPYDEQYKADIKVGEATGTMINGLRKHHKWAIHKRANISTVWAYPNLVFFDVLLEAEKELEILLRKNIDTAHKFL